MAIRIPACCSNSGRNQANEDSMGLRLAIAMCGSLLLVGCSSTSKNGEALSNGSAPASAVRGYKIGKPYSIKGVWYYPRVDYDYVEEGVASWYGPGFDGKATANGETYDMNDLTAAHRTLPMPCVVQVTNLENGRSLKLKVNDRGPFARDRIIDVSRRASQLLGFHIQGTTRVRVEIVEDESRMLAAALGVPAEVAWAAERSAVPSTPAAAAVPVTEVAALPVAMTEVAAAPVSASTLGDEIGAVPPMMEPSSVSAGYASSYTVADYTVADAYAPIPMDITDPRVVTGAFLGAIVAVMAAAMTMSSVGKAAMDMVTEIRRQFREIPGLLQGMGKPDTARCVAISTNAALREMVAPGLMAVTAPVVVGLFIGPVGLAGMLMGATIVGVVLALFMANSGGAWDNAKKYIEAGKIPDEKKGSDAHAAAVIGDTIGDPFKDTSGPAMNILIKLLSIVSLVIVPFIV